MTNKPPPGFLMYPSLPSRDRIVVGDIVILKSGGPLMTVYQTEELQPGVWPRDLVRTCWFGGTPELKRDAFAGTELKLAESIRTEADERSTNAKSE